MTADTERRRSTTCGTVTRASDALDPPVRRGGSTSWRARDVEEPVRDEHSTSTWLLEPMVERAGSSVEDGALSDEEVFAQHVARAV